MQGRYSFVGAQPSMEVVAQGRSVEVVDHRRGQNGATSHQELDDPMQVPQHSVWPAQCIVCCRKDDTCMQSTRVTTHGGMRSSVSTACGLHSIEYCTIDARQHLAVCCR